MDDLIARIRAAIDENERLLQLQCPSPWKLNAEEDEVWAADDELVADAHALSSNQQRNTARFIVRFDPAWAERQIAVHRKILDDILPEIETAENWQEQEMPSAHEWTRPSDALILALAEAYEIEA